MDRARQPPDGLPDALLGIPITTPLRGDRGSVNSTTIQSSALDDLGLDLRKVPDGGLEIGDGRVVWLSGNANWYPRSLRQLLAVPRESRPPVVIWHVEPLPLPADAPFPRQPLHAREIAKIVLRDNRATDRFTNSRLLRRLAAVGLPDLLVVVAPDMVEHLAEHGLAAEFVPFGYDRTFGRDLGLERDVDVLFLGALEVPRRKRVIRRLRRAGVDVQAVGAWHDPAYWGENRTRLLNRTKILLNLSRYPGQSSGYRLILGMTNGAAVVSEPIYRPEPFVPGTHFVSATVDEMPALVEHYLRDEADRRALARRGFEFVTQEVTMSGSLTRILELLHETIRRRPSSGPT